MLTETWPLLTPAGQVAKAGDTGVPVGGDITGCSPVTIKRRCQNLLEEEPGGCALSVTADCRPAARHKWGVEGLWECLHAKPSPRRETPRSGVPSVKVGSIALAHDKCAGVTLAGTHTHTPEPNCV